MTTTTARAHRRPSNLASPISNADVAPSNGAIRPWEIGLLLGLVGLFFALGIGLLLQHSPFGHDEAVYALKARSYAGEPGTGYSWRAYRAPGLPFMLRLIWPIAHGDAALRSVNLVIGAVGIVLTWLWARRWFGAIAAPLAAATLLSMPWYLGASYRLFVDAPSAVFGMLAIASFLFAIRDDGISPWALLAIPFAAIATFSRYGAPTLLAGSLAVVVLLYWRQALRSWRVTLAVAAGTGAAMALILLVPAVTGADVRPLRAYLDLKNSWHRHAFAAVGDFVHLTPETIGPVCEAVVLLGAVGFAYRVISGRWRSRPLLLVAGICVAFFVLINLAVPAGFPQYLLPGLPFLAILAAACAAPLLERAHPALTVALVVLIAAVSAPIVYSRDSTMGATTNRFSGMLRAGALELRQRDDGNCLLLTGEWAAAEWYSKCRTVQMPIAATTVSTYADALRRVGSAGRGDLPADAPVYWLETTRGTRQPSGKVQAALEALTKRTVVDLGDPAAGRGQHVTVGYLGTVHDVVG
ncbi:MAG: hypothetical protein QOI55_1808 [Actinomycetota bacterium]|nr:hypothetical protein [Actinomycetota bacterium]